ncbi:MAG: hypothetical protein RIQ60_3497 [Pseudomonadota bacterium]
MTPAGAATKQTADDAPQRRRRQLVRQITACWRSQAMHAAVQLDLPDQLAAVGPADLSTLAERCGCAPDGLRRLLDALCVLQVCRRGRDGHYSLASLGQCLCRQPADGATSLRDLALWWGGPLWPVLGDLTYSVRTGHSARTRQSGVAHYGFLQRQDGGAAEVFHGAMQAMTALLAGDVARLDTWAGARTLVDVGGGIGTLGVSIAAQHPQLALTVFDQDHARVGAERLLGAAALGTRARFMAGDFFADIPAGADRYLLKSILHNWDDEACRRLLALCARAAAGSARLLVVERLRPTRLSATVHDEALVRTDLNMLVGLGGRERSLAEYAELLASAGFEVSAVSPTRHEFSVIEAHCR